MRRLAALAVLAFAAPAHADFTHPAPGEVAVRDMPGTNRQWQEAHSVVDAPPEAVRRWVTDFEYWPGRFHDVKELRVLARTPTSARVWVNSDIMRQLTLNVKITDEGITYEANENHVKAAGRIFIRATPDGKTDVLMQTSANVTGFLGMLAPKSLIRDRERDKLTADLTDINRLAHSHRSARRPPPPARRD